MAFSFLNDKIVLLLPFPDKNFTREFYTREITVSRILHIRECYSFTRSWHVERFHRGLKNGAESDPAEIYFVRSIMWCELTNGIVYLETESTYYSIAGKRNFVSKLIKWWNGRNLFSKFILFYFKLTHGLSLYREKKREKRENLNWNSIKKKKERSEKVGVVNFFIYKLADKSIECSRVIKVKNKNFPFKYRNTLTPSSFPSFLFSSRINNFWIFKILHEETRPPSWEELNNRNNK